MRSRGWSQTLTAALLSSAVACDENDQVPMAPDAEVATVSLPLTFRQISAGNWHACGVTTDDRGYCWGINYSGQLGTGFGGAAAVTTPVPAASGLRFLEVRAGGDYSCGLTTDNRIYCWGLNTEGQLGYGSNSLYSLSPVQIAGGRRYRALRTGAFHACGITLSDVTYCWGANGYGQLGDGTTVGRRSPVKVAGGPLFLRVTAGTYHTCGLTSAKRAYCWGKNTNGQIGIRNSITQLKPIAVSGGFTFNTLSAGAAHTCAVAPDHKAYCWGWNKYGQLGDGSTRRHDVPFPVAGGLAFSGVSPGSGHTCGITTAKVAYCWGYNWYGQLGEGTSAVGGGEFVSQRLTPVAVAGTLALDAVLAGGGAHFSCGLTTDGRGYCWGENSMGYLGDGTTNNSTVPSPIAPTE